MDRRRDPEEDARLLARVCRGDAEAFTLLYRRHQTVIYRFALHMSGSSSIADDVTQEVFLSLMRDAHRFDAAKGTLIAYLYGAARHRVWRHVGRGEREVSLDATRDDPGAFGALVPDQALDPLAVIARAETIEAVRQAILELPVHFREVVVLCDLQELDYAEAAQALGCPIGTVRSRLSRGRARLATALRKSGAIAREVSALKPARYAT